MLYRAPDRSCHRGIITVLLPVDLRNPRLFLSQSLLFDLLHDRQLPQHRVYQGPTARDHSRQTRRASAVRFRHIPEVLELSAPTIELPNQPRRLLLPGRVQFADKQVVLRLHERGAGRARVLDLADAVDPPLEAPDGTGVSAGRLAERPHAVDDHVQGLYLLLEGPGAAAFQPPGPQREDVLAPCLGLLQLADVPAAPRELFEPQPELVPGALAPRLVHHGGILVQQLELEELRLQPVGLGGGGEVRGELGRRGRCEVGGGRGFRGESLGGRVVLLQGRESRPQTGLGLRRTLHGSLRIACSRPVHRGVRPVCRSRSCRRRLLS